MSVASPWAPRAFAASAMRRSAAGTRGSREDSAFSWRAAAAARLLDDAPHGGVQLVLALARPVRARELLVEALARVVRERARGLACDVRRRLGPHLLALEVALERVEEEAVVRDGEPARGGISLALRILEEGKGGTVPVEHFLLLLRADALVLEEKVEERGLWEDMRCDQSRAHIPHEECRIRSQSQQAH